MGAHLDVDGEGEGPAGHLPLVVEEALQRLGAPLTQQRAGLDGDPAEPARCMFLLQGGVGNAAILQQVARLAGDPVQQMCMSARLVGCRLLWAKQQQRTWRPGTPKGTCGQGDTAGSPMGSLYQDPGQLSMGPCHAGWRGCGPDGSKVTVCCVTASSTTDKPQPGWQAHPRSVCGQPTASHGPLLLMMGTASLPGVETTLTQTLPCATVDRRCSATTHLSPPRLPHAHARTHSTQAHLVLDTVNMK